MNTPTARLSDLIEQIRGVTYRKNEASTEPREGYLPILRAGNISDNGLLTFTDLVYVPESRINKRQLLQQHDILLATSSGSLDVVGKAAQASEDFRGGFGAFCKVLRPNERVNPRYLAHFFGTSTYRTRVSALAAGASINNLRNEHIDELTVRLPPLKEQRKIVAVLDRADEVRAKRLQALAQLDDLTQSIFLDMFGDLRKEPGGWSSAPLRELVTEFRYGTSTKSAPEGKPTLRIPNVVSGSLDLNNLKLVPVRDVEFARLRLADDDVIFVRTNGNPDLVGRCAVFNEELVADTHFPSDEFIYASYLIRARLSLEAVSPVFVQAFMNGPFGRKTLREHCKTSAGQYNININGLGSVAVPVPPLELQNQYASRIAEVDRMKNQHQEHLAELDALFDSLRDRAFAGRL